MTAPRILIIGGGIGGLTAALALQRAGWTPKVVEQSPVLGDVGAGVTLAPNACKALRSLGVLDQVRPRANAPQRHEVRHWRSGETTDAFEAGAALEARYGAPFLQVHRSDLHGALAASVQRGGGGDCIQLGRRLRRVDRTHGEIRAHFSDGPSEGADILIGADGVRSVVRDAVVDAGAPGFSGFVAWRSVVPAARLPELSKEPGSVLHLGPGRSLLRYFVRNGEAVNCVAFAQREAWAEEGWSIAAPPGELSDGFEGWCPEAQATVRAMEGPGCYRWGLFARVAPTTWVRGPIALLGDAAHPMLPFLGQGATMAIEDGVVLGRCLVPGGDPVAMLRRYEATRFARATWVVRTANAEGLRMHGASPAPADQFTQSNESFTAFDHDASTADLAPVK